jgi:hypothetical protein
VTAGVGLLETLKERFLTSRRSSGKKTVDHVIDCNTNVALSLP